jgi:small subunit ribosomal protein S17
MAEEQDTTETTDETTEAPAPTPAAPAAAAPSPARTGGPPAERQEVLPPKERRRRARAAKAARVRPRSPRSPEERQQERDAERRRKSGLRRTERARAKAETPAAQREPTAPRERAPGVQKVRQGVVVSDKADKTITVRIDLARRHRRYAKIVRTSNTLHAHDERNDAHIGDTVIVREARPLSRTKRWRLVEVVERAR